LDFEKVTCYKSLYNVYAGLRFAVIQQNGWKIVIKQ
jgi:hypothetical protein